MWSQNLRFLTARLEKTKFGMAVDFFFLTIVEAFRWYDVWMFFKELFIILLNFDEFIFQMQNFVKVAKTSDLKSGQMKCVNIQGQRLLLANVEGHFYATSDTCTHEDASLAKGKLEGEWVTCPLHGSRFNIRNGQVQEEPAEEPLRTYPLRIEEHTLLVDIS